MNDFKIGVIIICVSIPLAMYCTIQFMGEIITVNGILYFEHGLPLSAIAFGQLLTLITLGFFFVLSTPKNANSNT